MISKRIMNVELDGHLIFCQDYLDSQDCNIIIGSLGGTYSFQALSTSLRNAYRSEALPASFMITCPPAHCRNQPHEQRATRQNHPANLRTTKKGREESSLFHTFIS